MGHLARKGFSFSFVPNVWKNSGADQWNYQTNLKFFTCSRVLSNFAEVLNRLWRHENMFCYVLQIHYFPPLSFSGIWTFCIVFYFCWRRFDCAYAVFFTGCLMLFWKPSSKNISNSLFLRGCLVEFSYCILLSSSLGIPGTFSFMYLFL